MNKSIRVLHTEWSDGWGGQEIRIINEILAMRSLDVKVYLACTEYSQIRQKALENNIKFFRLPFKGNADMKTFFALKKIIRQHDIDIVNTHSGKDTWVGGLAAKLSGAKFIRTRHLSTPIRSSRTNFINELADYIFTTGESVRQDMIDNNRIRPDRIESIPTGIDAEIYQASNFNRDSCREQFGFQANQIIIGIVAVLRSFKRHDRFLKMVRYVLDVYSEKNIHFVIAGDGPQREKLVEMIDELDLNKHVSMLGHVSSVTELLCALDLFVLTSDSGEGVPQSVMQALLMNKAVVATSAGSTGDLHNGSNFIMVSKDSQLELNEACQKLVADETLRDQYAGRARDYVLERFSKDKMTENIMRIYLKLLS